MSLVYVLIAALALIAGSATLMNRTSSTLFGSIFQGQSWQARETARIGMNYFISQINKERNRHLLVVNKTQLAADPNADTKLWGSTANAQGNRNPCIPKNPDGSAVLPSLSDFNLSGSPPKGELLYINEDTGSITTQRGSSTRAFRIATDQDFRRARKEYLNLLDDTQNKGFFRLTVEAIVYKSSTSSEVASRIFLQEDFDVIPKCCKLSFGSVVKNGETIGHGSYSYNIDPNDYNIDLNDIENGCLSDPDRFGVALGFGDRDVESRSPLTSIGGALIQNEEGIPIKDILCIDTTGTCIQPGTLVDGEVVNQVTPIDVSPPDPPQYPGTWGTGSPPPLIPCTASKCGSNKDPSAVTAGAKQLTYYDSINRLTIFDATNLSETNLPGNCTITKKGDPLLPQREELHCAFSSISLGGNQLRFITGTYGVTGATGRLLRLYFPVGGVVLQRTGGGAIDHCKSGSLGPCDPPSPYHPSRYTDLSWFGCSSCGVQTLDIRGVQTLDIQGSASSINMFIFMPFADASLSGNSKYKGVFWGNTIYNQGNAAYPIVPSSGVAEVFILLGILPDENGTFDNSIAGETETDFLPFDMIARSSSRFRFFGN